MLQEYNQNLKIKKLQAKILYSFGNILVLTEKDVISYLTDKFSKKE